MANFTVAQGFRVFMACSLIGHPSAGWIVIKNHSCHCLFVLASVRGTWICVENAAGRRDVCVCGGGDRLSLGMAKMGR